MKFDQICSSLFFACLKMHQKADDNLRVISVLVNILIESLIYEIEVTKLING